MGWSSRGHAARGHAHLTHILFAGEDKLVAHDPVRLALKEGGLAEYTGCKMQLHWVQGREEQGWMCSRTP